ncbi:MAG TPA: PilZ domain-containing protein [Nitrospiraceae bacterium]|jgi:PAS domain S-box-containing protein|nr:PilZ domain-containing protein [Nitrospiraceae bacterium]
MPQSEPVSTLIISEHAESIKLITVSLRGFFPGCRVDVAYSAEEARSWASSHEWPLILIDEQCLAGDHTSLPGEFKRRAPYAGIILYSDRSDSAAAIQALQADVDFFLSKKSSAFLTELLFCAKEAIEKRHLSVTLEHALERHRRLVESLSDIAYELDASGCFVAVSPGIVTLLGYSPDELIGLPYTTLVPPNQESVARYRLNERRSGARGTSRVELTLRGKPTQDKKPLPLTAEVNARGLYDTLRRFLGTVGLIRDLSQAKQQDTTIHQLRQQLQQRDALLALAQQVTLLSQQLHDPLASLSTHSQQLLTTIRNAHLDDQAETLAGHAAEATNLGAQLAQVLQERGDRVYGHTINEVLEDVLTSTTSAIVDSAGIIRRFSSHLPPLVGNLEQAKELVYHLLNYAQTYLLTIGRAHRLIVSTRAVGTSSISADAPALFPLAPPTEIEVELLESDMAWSSQSPVASPPSFDLLGSYELVRRLDGTLDLSAPMQGPFRMILRLPVASRSPLEILPLPMADSPAPPAPAPDIKRAAPAPVPAADFDRLLQERRHSPRILSTLPATITVGSTTWDGTISNLSLGGACITLPGDFPTVSPQDAYVVIKTAVGILELVGRAQERSVSIHTKPPAAQLILTFEPPKREEGTVLASLIQAAQEQSLPFSLEVLLVAEPQDILITSKPIAPGEPQDYDLREAVRVTLQLPVRLDLTDSAGRSFRLEALTTNLSRDGACLHLSARSELLNGIATLHFAITQNQKHPGTHEPGAPDAALTARVVWSAPEPATPGEFRHPGSDPALWVGLRFQGLTPYAEREVNRVVQQHLTSLDESKSSSQQASVVSMQRECRNLRGQMIVIEDDHLRQSLEPNTPVVIIAPGYGQTALDASTLSYYLAHHRLRVLRYDHTNHVGLSDGELQQTTLRSMQADLFTVVEFVQHTWPTAPLIVMASDMTARVAIKMAVHSRPLDLLLLINPVVDIQAMLMTVHGHDLVADHRYGLRRGIANLLGLNVNVDRFVGDVVAGHFTDLASTISDLRLLRSPSAILMTPSSPLGPLPPADLPQAFLTALGANTRLATVLAPLLGQNLPLNEQHPPAFHQILEQIAATVSLPATPAEFSIHTRRMLARQQRIEMERARLRHNLSQIAREALRVAHLQLLKLGNLHEHWKLLDDLYRLLSPLEPGSMLVEVGVGHGDFVRATMVNQAYRSRQRGWSPERPVKLIGLEHAQDSLTQARQSLRALHRELDSDFGGTLTIHPPLTTEWMRADWTQGLPFKDHSLHRIVGNLSLPFVPSPLVTIRELHRMLHPQGRLVLTVFHPDTDLSLLYRRHLQRANQDEFSPQAQIVLHYLGRLREAIRYGLLHTFDRSSLTSFLQQAGILTFRIFPALDGHALFAVIEKD